MTMKRCNNGHFYDSSKYQQCPYCGISNMDASKTMPIIVPKDETVGSTFGSAVGTTVAMTAEDLKNRQSSAKDDGKTVGIMKQSKGIDPVVGWVVCIEGPAKGMDYRIKSERNFIGRDASMDIAITSDNGISRNNHAAISYNPKNHCFRLLPGESHGLVYLNDDEVYAPAELKHGDIIELGQTKLVFVPFCGGGFEW